MKEKKVFIAAAFVVLLSVVPVFSGNIPGSPLSLTETTNQDSEMLADAGFEQEDYGVTEGDREMVEEYKEPEESTQEVPDNPAYPENELPTDEPSEQEQLPGAPEEEREQL